MSASEGSLQYGICSLGDSVGKALVKAGTCQKIRNSLIQCNTCMIQVYNATESQVLTEKHQTMEKMTEQYCA